MCCPAKATISCIHLELKLTSQLNLLEAEAEGPCANFRIGDDDLQAYDFIRQFKLDLLGSQSSGVSKVVGSSSLQTAYRFQRYADVTVPTRNIFPFGLPEQFSFISTYRASRITRTAWHMIRLTNLQHRPQFFVALNPRQQSIDFAISNYEGQLQTLRFNNAKVSNCSVGIVIHSLFEIHALKIYFHWSCGATDNASDYGSEDSRDRVRLFVDCKDMQEKPMQLRGPMDINGNISIAKFANSRESVPANRFAMDVDELRSHKTST
ncbi:hypothetical protein D910_07748 [Dendroctonus ponderosae]|uniref:Thrombospondin-like N-terminal domain-containing protein n=1 Tax=Dendroctonus ponderosae TaxID=77166 RepID=U4U919_DENPD|nr:hypothetical protein D910_07748 [Dendroctonus ponderosae]